MPIDEIKDYFGGRIGLYFNFLGHYTTYLIPLAIVGLIFFIVLLLQSNQSGGYSYALSNSVCTPLFCICSIVWGQVMYEMWKRREAVKALEWGTTDIGGNKLEASDDETERPDYQGGAGLAMVSSVDAGNFPGFSERESPNCVRILVSLGSIVGALAILFFSLGVFYIVDLVFGAVVTFLIVAVVIQIMTEVYFNVSLWLTR